VSAHRYRFRNTWWLDVPAREVFGALADLASYPRWWRDVRAVRQLDEHTAHVTCRAVLPYSLDLRLRRAEEDDRTGRLRVDLTGDLEGFCSCLISGNGSGSRVELHQEVDLRKPQLRRVERWLGPLYRANHAAMMWRGRRGLHEYLAEGKPGR
jgi:hypothetical protein